jgi:nickel-type superoxide dismutase maturation protease
MAWPMRIAVVEGPSMVPALRHGDRLLVRMRSSRRTPAIGTVVVIELPERPLSVKRLVAIETDGRVRVEGDNEFGSTDSRDFGALPVDAIQGIAWIRLWPRPGRLRRRSA